MTFEVGLAWPELRERFTRERIAHYAEAGGDMNPIHLDDDVARAVGLPGVIAHGLLTMAGLARAVTDQLDRPEHLLELSTRFSGMVLPEEEIDYQGRIVALEAGRLEIELQAGGPEGKRVLTRARALVATS